MFRDPHFRKRIQGSEAHAGGKIINVRIFAACLEALGPSPPGALQIRQLYEAFSGIGKSTAKPLGNADVPKSLPADGFAPGAASHPADDSSTPQLQSGDDSVIQTKSACGSVSQPVDAEGFTSGIQLWRAR